MKLCIKSAIFGFIIGLGIIILITLYKKPDPVYVNMDKIIEAVAKEIEVSEEAKDESATKRAIESYRSIFIKEIEDYSKKWKVIVFSSPKPIAGASDKTEYFIKKVIKSKDSSSTNNGTTLKKKEVRDE